MARPDKNTGWIIIIALAFVLLFALNPSKDDFLAWRSAQAEGEATTGTTSGLVGVMKKGTGAVAGAMTALTSRAFERKDYLVCSTYSFGNYRYLGIAHFFIKLR